MDRATCNACFFENRRMNHLVVCNSMQAIDHLRCPLCNSKRVWKDGLRYTQDGEVQRYLCRSCGYRFSETSLNRSDPPEQVKVVDTKKSYRPVSHILNRQVCVTETQGAKNLAEVESRTEKRAAGATAQPSEAEVRSMIFEFAWWIKKRNYAQTTIEVYTKDMRTLARHGANLLDPESVKGVIAKQDWGNSKKNVTISAYSLFLKMLGRVWEPPFRKVTRKLPFIPMEEEIDQLISSCGKITATFLQLLKETAMRPGEAIRLEWIDIDFTRRTITLNYPEKRGTPRIFKVSPKLIAMLNNLPKKGAKIFGGPTSLRRTTFHRSRQHAARKFGNPRLLRISFSTLRHWKATMLYHQTKDILFVKQFLGHKKIENTLIYIQLADVIFKETTDEFTVRVASKPDEIKSLLEVGFEYVCKKDTLLFFRKRK